MPGPKALPPLAAAAILAFLSSCSFNYGTDVAGGPAVPGLVIENARAARYEDGSLSVVIDAGILEMYDEDQVWAGERIAFRQYASDGSGILEAEGSAGTMLVDDANKVYTLGDDTRFRYVPDGISLEAPDIRWEKKTSRLRGTADGVVRIEKDDGSSVEGTGFFADTLGRDYRFASAVSGAMVRQGEGEE